MWVWVRKEGGDQGVCMCVSLWMVGVWADVTWRILRKAKKKKNKPQKTRKVEKKSPRNQQLESSPIRQNEQEY